MRTRAKAIEPEVRDFAPGSDLFLSDVLAGLSRPKKELPCKYLYDEKGSELFERICDLDEYYLTRTELSIMEEHAPQMAKALGTRVLLMEYGSGSGKKTRHLLDHLEDPAGYVPIDISRDALEKSVAELRQEYPKLEVIPVCADYTKPFAMPAPSGPVDHRAVYFPGSTVGNFAPIEARNFLVKVVKLVGARGGLLIGVDLKKDRKVLEAAYDDREGVTAAFDLNMLERINRELGGDFDLESFTHRAVYNEDAGRIEMHLVSRRAQSVRIGGRSIRFGKGETIHTESSHKFEIKEFQKMAAAAGLTARKVWTDPKRLFSVHHLTVA